MMQEKSLNKTLLRFALKYFAPISNKLKIPELIKDSLRKADIYYTAQEYAAISFMVAFLSSIYMFFLIAVILAILHFKIFNIFLFSFFFSFIFFLIVLFVFLVYPSIAISDRKKNISQNLPFASIYLSTLASAGMSPYQMFKVLANFEEFGEISKEAKRILRDVDILGYDTLTAIERAANRTPSPQFRELLWGLRSSILSGGDLRSYLLEKAKSLMQEYRRSLDRFMDQLSLLIEIYVTLVIVGSIFMVVMGVIMGFMGWTDILSSVKIAVYIGIPLASVLFMLVVASISPE